MTNPQATAERIAINVMGWHEKRVADHPSNPVWYVDEQGTGKIYKSYWHPETSIEQAFRAVEKMRERGWRFYLSGIHPGREDDWMAQLANDKYNLHGLGATPELAICNAIIAVLDAEKK